MKKYIFSFILIFAFVFSFGFDVSATSTTEENNADSGTVEQYATCGSVRIVQSRNEGGYTYDWSIAADFVCNDYGALYIVKRKRDDVTVDDMVFPGYQFHVICFSKPGTPSGYKGSATYESVISTVTTYNGIESKPSVGSETGSFSYSADGKVVAARTCCVLDLIDVDGIPIFDEDDTDAINAYKNSGDVSGATNSDTFVEKYDDAIPLPHNFRIVSGNKQPVSGVDVYPNRFNKDIVLAWEQSDVVDGLVSDIQVSFTTIEKEDANSMNTRESTSSYYDVVKDISYNGTPSMTIKIGYQQLNTLRDKDGLLLSKVTFRIRNRVGKKTSNWVRVTLDLKTGKATATEENYDDETDTGGDEYNDNTVSPPDDSSGNVSIDGIMNYIRGGFGLLGDTGIIALMSQCFLYLPGNVWSIIYFYLSMVVAIALFAVFVKVVF